MLEIIKKRCYIYTEVFDEEIKSLISAGITDCIQSGISADKFKPLKKKEENEADKYDDQVINCITAFVKANRGNDRSDTEVYMKMYESYRDKMTLEGDYKAGDTNE